MNRALARLRLLLNSRDAGPTSSRIAGTDFSRPWHRACLATFALSWTSAIALVLIFPPSPLVTSSALALILLGAVAGISLLVWSIASSVADLRAR